MSLRLPTSLVATLPPMPEHVVVCAKGETTGLTAVTEGTAFEAPLLLAAAKAVAGRVGDWKWQRLMVSRMYLFREIASQLDAGNAAPELDEALEVISHFSGLARSRKAKAGGPPSDCVNITLSEGTFTFMVSLMVSGEVLSKHPFKAGSSSSKYTAKKAAEKSATAQATERKLEVVSLIGKLKTQTAAA